MRGQHPEIRLPGALAACTDARSQQGGGAAAIARLPHRTLTIARRTHTWQVNKSKPLIILFKCGLEVARMNLANGNELARLVQTHCGEKKEV